MKKVMFISSVGGHLTQMLELKSLFKDYDYVLVTEKTDVTKDMNKKYKMDYLMYGSRFFMFKYIWVCFCNFFKSIYLFIKYNPKVIVTTGAHTAVLICYLGWIFRRKVIFIESYAKRKDKTLAGKLVYPIATHFVVQWETMKELYPKAKFFGGIY